MDSGWYGKLQEKAEDNNALKRDINSKRMERQKAQAEAHREKVQNLFNSVGEALKKRKQAEYEAHQQAESERAKEEARQNDIKKNGITDSNSPEMRNAYRSMITDLHFEKRADSTKKALGV